MAMATRWCWVSKVQREPYSDPTETQGNGPGEVPREPLCTKVWEASSPRGRNLTPGSDDSQALVQTQLQDKEDSSHGETSGVEALRITPSEICLPCLMIDLEKSRITYFLHHRNPRFWGAPSLRTWALTAMLLALWVMPIWSLGQKIMTIRQSSRSVCQESWHTIFALANLEK